VIATFRTIGKAIVERQQTELTYLETCRTYAGEIDDITTGIPFVAPASFTIFEGMERTTVTLEAFGQNAFQVRYTVIVVARTLEGKDDVAEDAEFSAHRMIEDTVVALTSTNLGLEDFEGLTFERARRIRIVPTEAIYALDFSGIVTGD